jgi:hypothetical protein
VPAPAAALGTTPTRQVAALCSNQLHLLFVGATSEVWLLRTLVCSIALRIVALARCTATDPDVFEPCEAHHCDLDRSEYMYCLRAWSGESRRYLCNILVNFQVSLHIYYKFQDKFCSVVFEIASML